MAAKPGPFHQSGPGLDDTTVAGAEDIELESVRAIADSQDGSDEDPTEGSTNIPACSESSSSRQIIRDPNTSTVSAGEENGTGQASTRNSWNESGNDLRALEEGPPQPQELENCCGGPQRKDFKLSYRERLKNVAGQGYWDKYFEPLGRPFDHGHEICVKGASQVKQVWDTKDLRSEKFWQYHKLSVRQDVLVVLDISLESILRIGNSMDIDLRFFCEYRHRPDGAYTFDPHRPHRHNRYHPTYSWWSFCCNMRNERQLPIFTFARVERKETLDVWFYIRQGAKSSKTVSYLSKLALTVALDFLLILLDASSIGMPARHRWWKRSEKSAGPTCRSGTLAHFLNGSADHPDQQELFDLTFFMARWAVSRYPYRRKLNAAVQSISRREHAQHRLLPLLNAELWNVVIMSLEKRSAGSCRIPSVIRALTPSAPSMIAEGKSFG